MPRASVAIICAAASISCGNRASRPFVNSKMIVTAALAICGMAATIPFARATIISTPASSKAGRLASTACPIAGTMADTFSNRTSTRPLRPSAKVSAEPAVPSRTPCKPSPMRATKGSMACNTSAAMNFSVVIIGSAIAPSSA